MVLFGIGSELFWRGGQLVDTAAILFWRGVNQLGTDDCGWSSGRSIKLPACFSCARYDSTSRRRALSAAQAYWNAVCWI